MTRSRHLHERLTRRNSGSASLTTASTSVGAGAGAAQGFSSWAAPRPMLLFDGVGALGVLWAASVWLKLGASDACSGLRR